MIYIRPLLEAVEVTEPSGKKKWVQDWGPGIYHPISDGAYRLTAWMGLFERNLRPARLGTRAFLLDECWRITGGPQDLQAKIEGRPAPVKRGCGCREKKA